MELHYSQTTSELFSQAASFYYLMELHYSQTTTEKCTVKNGFTTLWNYTILKH